MNTNSRKDKYVAKAISILKQEGFRLSLDEMATKMGITKKTLYNNFSSKEEPRSACTLSQETSSVCSRYSMTRR